MDRTRLPDRDQLFWLFFRFSGRVSRAAYFLAGLLLAVVQVFLLYRFTLVPEESAQGQFWAFAFWAAVLISIWSNLALSVKRLHDLDKPGIIAVTLFIPVVSIIAFLVLCIFPGTSGPNRYGAATNQPK
ncbi:DUF805 domain-containing protein [Mesorhizobium sp. WSM2239]|jgi:uncharacterized membrane protein YhaH (DUF805 family)|uniref:DUF805 domain-containing protein n=2 Tax=unclassified Mesorhizobium TaxID=325217 RepID=A0AAU8D7Q5_9HYPH